MNDKIKNVEELKKAYCELEKEFAKKNEKIAELKGERLNFYTDDVRRTQVINGVHFDTEQLLVFSEYVEQQKMVIAEKDKKNAVLEKALDKEKRSERKDYGY